MLEITPYDLGKNYDGKGNKTIFLTGIWNVGEIISVNQSQHTCGFLELN